MLSLEDLVITGGFTRLRIAVAYATLEGVNLLQKILATRSGHLNVSLIVGLDGFVTQPQAIRSLQQLYETECKFILTTEVNAIFHAKGYFFESFSGDYVGAFVGSANLTGSGLGRNTELGIVTRCHGAQARQMKSVWDSWWSTIWAEARLLSGPEVQAYEVDFKRGQRKLLHGDRVVTAQNLSNLATSVAEDASSAKSLWLDAGRITGGAGNQLELMRPIVSYFGDLSNVETRAIKLQMEAQCWSNNVVRYYPNSGMWRINIEAELVRTIGGLRNKTVFFERQGPDTYQVRTLDYSEIKTIRELSEEMGGIGETSTREYGWY
jgi:hypothetical protein